MLTQAEHTALMAMQKVFDEPDCGFNSATCVGARRELVLASSKAVLNMQLDANLLKAGHEMAGEDGISLSGLVRRLLLREKKRREAEKGNPTAQP